VILVEILLCLLATALLVPVSVFLLQVLMALPAYRTGAMPGGRRPAVAVVIPAHNEAPLIANTLRSIVPQMAAGDRLVVVADNCSDDTATLAAEAGAEVLERYDLERRGKGYALDYGIRHLERNAPEVVLIVDADCEVDGGAIDRLARVCVEADRPVQALYLMRSAEDAGLGLDTGIAEFAWLVKNQVRALGNHRLGWPCLLMGAGMASPWARIRAAALASGHLVEDLKLGIDLTRSGAPPLFCPEARVISYFPATIEGLAAQRTRWEHGHLGVIVSEAPRLLKEALAQGNMKLLALLLDVCVPPLALLMLLILALLAAGAAVWMTAGIALPFWLALAALMMLGSAVLLSWQWHGRRVIRLSKLCLGFFYALWKIPLYAKFLVRRQVDWVGSRRIS
jgi:cellulose synthase/poly-beta-1,6-N-acetylglucosamine synthase-like glycosyltransferase